MPATAVAGSSWSSPSLVRAVPARDHVAKSPSDARQRSRLVWYAFLPAVTGAPEPGTARAGTVIRSNARTTVLIARQDAFIGDFLPLEFAVAVAFAHIVFVFADDRGRCESGR